MDDARRSFAAGCRLPSRSGHFDDFAAVAIPPGNGEEPIGIGRRTGPAFLRVQQNLFASHFIEKRKKKELLSFYSEIYSNL